MEHNRTHRRHFLQTAGALTGAALLGRRMTGAAAAAEGAASEAKDDRLHLACNQYNWHSFYAREDKNFGGSLDAGIAEVAKSGVDGFEPLAGGPGQIDRIADLLEREGLQMRSLYINSTLHDKEKADQSIEQVLAVARRAKEQAGTGIVVTNPSPIRWGGDAAKTDEQLLTQAAAMTRLAGKLDELGMTLAYHNHDVELKNAAREFHHMMVGTDPGLVTLCLDAHWIYRGSGNSSVALFDVVRLYGRRISELHLRQSEGGTWTETLRDGDIDYRRLAAMLAEMNVRPHLVIEQAVEGGTPHTMGPVEAHRKSVEYARAIFGDAA